MNDTITAGYDFENEKYFISFDPYLREVYCVMIMIDGRWLLRRLYSNKGTSEKIRKRAVQFCNWCRKVYPRHKFKIDKGLEDVPLKELEVFYYEKIEEVVEEIWDRYGRNIFLGVGSTQFYADHKEGIQEFGKILQIAGQEKVPVVIRKSAPTR